MNSVEPPRRHDRAQGTVVLHDDEAGALTAALGGVTAAIGTWYLVGDLTESPSHTDRMLDPPAVPPLVEHAVGIGALVALGAGRVTMLRAASRRAHRSMNQLILLVAAGMLLGLIGRMVTAGGIGANIGGGLAIMFGLPVVAALVLVAVVIGWRRL